LDMITKANQDIFLTQLRAKLSEDSDALYVSGANFDWGYDYLDDSDPQDGDPDDSGHREKTLEFVQSLLTSVSYSPYLGIELISPGALHKEYGDPVNDTYNYFTIYGDGGFVINDIDIGGYAKIYNGLQDGPLTKDEWIAKYSIDKSDPYFAITQRFKIDQILDPEGSSEEIKRASLLRGGDCYTGFYFQRVWRPKGVEGVPTASNPLAYAYEADTPIREGTGITSSGMAIGFPVRSKYNFAIRALVDADSYQDATGTGAIELATEEGLYREDDVLGNRQPETNMINYGNFVEGSALSRTIADSSIPYAKIDYPNRVMVSEVSVTGEFDNGYRNFKGLNFKDYDEDLGDIVALTSGNLYTYIVYRNGVAIIEVQERTAISGEESANIYIEAAQALPPKSIVVLTTIGSQHLKSISNTEGAVYGYDHSLGKIWKVSGNDKTIISDYRFNTQIRDIKNKGVVTNVTSTYNTKNYCATFTFTYDDPASDIAVIYDTINDLWYGTSDIVKLYEANIDDAMLSLIRHAPASYYLTEEMTSSHPKIANPGVRGKSYLDVGGVIYPRDTYIEFVTKYDILQKFLLKTLTITGTGAVAKMEIFPESSPEFAVWGTTYKATERYSPFLTAFTPVYLREQGQVVFSGNYAFTRQLTPGLKALAIGDEIELHLIDTNDLPTTKMFRIADLTVASDVETVTVDREITRGALATTADLSIGWKVPLRVALGRIASGYTYISIPTKRVANLLTDSISEGSTNYYAKADRARPYGKWIRVRLWFNGMDPIYISSIDSGTTLRY